MTAGRPLPRSGLSILEASLCLGIFAGVVLTAQHMYGLIVPWQRADFGEAIDVSPAVTPIFASAVMQGGERRGRDDVDPVVLTAKDASGLPARVELSRMAAYVLAQAGKDRR